LFISIKTELIGIKLSMSSFSWKPNLQVVRIYWDAYANQNSRSVKKSVVHIARSQLREVWLKRVPRFIKICAL
jgi:hypothetical protein